MDSSHHLDGDSTDDFVRTVEATAEAAHQLRQVFTLWMTARIDAGPERRADIVLAVYEAVANATEHAYNHRAEPGAVTVHGRTTNGALQITVTDTGTWDPSPSQRFRGRGLALITALSDTHALTSGPHGTTVTMSWQLSVEVSGATGRGAPDPRSPGRAGPSKPHHRLGCPGSPMNDT